MTGLRRNLSERIDRLLEVFPVVMLVGARQAGKTTLSRMVRPGWRYFDLENAADYDLITRDYDFFFREYPRRVVIDEAQEDPRLFRQLRGVVDAARHESGRFLLTGSSSPDLIREASDSLAGRIAVVEVGTLKINPARRHPVPAVRGHAVLPLRDRHQQSPTGEVGGRIRGNHSGLPGDSGQDLLLADDSFLPGRAYRGRGEVAQGPGAGQRDQPLSGRDRFPGKAAARSPGGPELRILRDRRGDPTRTPMRSAAAGGRSRGLRPGTAAAGPCVPGYAVAMPIFFFKSASASAPEPGEGADSALSMSSSIVPPTSASWS